MRCPTDQTALQLAERHGIEIDYCPECRGVWLDRGELDKIVARAGGDAPAPRAAYDDDVRAERYRDDRRGRDDDYDDDDDRYARSGKRRRSSFLGELFDFG